MKRATGARHIRKRENIVGQCVDGGQRDGSNAPLPITPGGHERLIQGLLITLNNANQLVRSNSLTSHLTFAEYCY
jgi:hypothetical protein